MKLAAIQNPPTSVVNTVCITTADKATTTYTGSLSYERGDDGGLRIIRADGAEIAYYKPDFWLAVSCTRDS